MNITTDQLKQICEGLESLQIQVIAGNTSQLPDDIENSDIEFVCHKIKGSFFLECWNNDNLIQDFKI